MEEHYHLADQFRWSLNSFLRALKEVPQQIQMVLQNDEPLVEWYRAQRDILVGDPLISHLFKTRDFVVHQGMLLPGSKATIGITEGRGIKLGIGLDLHPLEDSDAGMIRYLLAGDFLRVLPPDDDSMPCVHRVWRIEAFPDAEIIDLSANAWLSVGRMLSAVHERCGHGLLDLSLSCRHSPQRVQYKLYEREVLQRWVKVPSGQP